MAAKGIAGVPFIVRYLGISYLTCPMHLFYLPGPKDSEFIASVRKNAPPATSTWKKKEESKTLAGRWRVWSADTALQRPGHLPGPQGSLKHAGKPLGLGHYRLTVASKKHVRRQEIPCPPVSPSHYPDYLSNQTALSASSVLPSCVISPPSRGWAHLPRVTAHSVETDGVSLCSRLFRL